LSFPFDHIVGKDNNMVKSKRQHCGQKEKKTIWSKGKDNTMVKRRRQHYGQKEKTTLWSKEEDNTMVKRKKTTLWSKVFFF
jgi:hypothetical protein